jgi:hypothetical protein
MQATPRDPRAHDDKRSDSSRHDGADHARDVVGERARFAERRRRVGAAQMAAPSTRRWRRAVRSEAPG